MVSANAEKEVLVRGARLAFPNETMSMWFKTDEQGWPMVRFEPADPALHLAGEFLRSDVDVVLPSCDLIIVSIVAVLADKQARWRWNGNSFWLDAEKSSSRLVDKYGAALGSARSADLPTPGLLQIVRAWRDFVAEIPRQAELRESQPTVQS